MARYHRSPPTPVELDVCLVCAVPVMDDPRRERQRRGDPSAPVKMEDGDYTHVGCRDEYWPAAQRLAALYDAEAGAWLDGDYSDDLGTGTSAASEYQARQRERMWDDPPHVNLGGAA
jgi:hypothetical protein